MGVANEVGVKSSPADIAAGTQTASNKNKKPRRRATLADNIGRKIKGARRQFKFVLKWREWMGWM